MKLAAWLAGVLGLALATLLIAYEGYGEIVEALARAGWSLLWLAPYRLVYFVLYAIAWRLLLRPHDPGQRAGTMFLLWVATVREGIDRLLPVAGVGGGVVGVRLVAMRGLDGAAVTASVVVEVLLTVVNLYLFTALGLILLAQARSGNSLDWLVSGFLLSLPVPIVTALLLRHGSVFQRLQKLLERMISGDGAGGRWQSDSAAVDREIVALYRRWRELLGVGSLQFAALLFGSFEVWFALQLLGHPVSVAAAVALESLSQAVRHFAFFVPAGLGVQEVSLVAIGQVFGLPGEVALALSLAKRMREVVCGLPALVSWQFVEGRRLRALLGGFGAR